MLPMIRRNAASTPISIRNETSSAKTVEYTRIWRGKYTFLMIPALPSSAIIDPLRLPARKFHGNRPQSRKAGKLLSPDGSPTGIGTLSSTPKTREKMAIVARGLSNDQVQPSVDRLYLPRSSRSVRLTTRSRDSDTSVRRDMKSGASEGQ